MTRLGLQGIRLLHGDLGLLRHPPDQTLQSSQRHQVHQQDQVAPRESLQQSIRIPRDLLNVDTIALTGQCITHNIINLIDHSWQTKQMSKHFRNLYLSVNNLLYHGQYDYSTFHSFIACIAGPSSPTGGPLEVLSPYRHKEIHLRCRHLKVSSVRKGWNSGSPETKEGSITANCCTMYSCVFLFCKKKWCKNISFLDI